MFRKLTLKVKEGVMEKTGSQSTLRSVRKPYKIFLIGDSSCGKSSLLKRYTKKTFSEDYVPTVFDSASAEIVADQNNDIKLNIWDTSGSPEFDHIRPLSFGDAAVFVVCFDLEKPASSLENIQKKWLPEMREQHSSVPFILVGLKSDLKSETKSNNFCQQGMSLATQVGAAAYVECSSKSDENASKVDKLFYTTALLATGQLSKVPKDIRPRVQKSKPNPSCSIM